MIRLATHTKFIGGRIKVLSPQNALLGKGKKLSKPGDSNVSLKRTKKKNLDQVYFLGAANACYKPKMRAWHI